MVVQRIQFHLLMSTRKIVWIIGKNGRSFLRFFFWIECFFLYSCQQLELQLQSSQDQLSLNDAQIQCSIDKHDQITQTTDNEKLIDENILKTETEKFKSQINVLQDEINNLNFQLSSFIIQRTTTENVRNEVLVLKKY